MTIHDIYDKDAKQLLNRICKAISTKCGYIVRPVNCKDGATYIISSDDEVASISCPKYSKFVMFFNTTKDMIQTLLTPKTAICFHPYGKDAIKIDVSDMLGTTLDEVYINLDLMN